MIELAIKTLEPLLSSLPYVGHYGGLSFVATRTMDGKKEAFPVQSTLTQLECWNSGKYRNLTPNSSYSTLFYWECNREMQEVSDPKTPLSVKTFSGTARLVYWLNLAKIGKAATGLSSSYGMFTLRPAIEANIIKVLQADKKVLVTSPEFAGASVSVLRASIVKKELSIFSKYTYDTDNVQQLLYYPYDFGAIDFELVLRVPQKCISEVTIDTPIDCITNW